MPLPPTDYGPRWLLRPEIAALVEDVLFRAQDEWKLLDLDAWVILPNQIHVLYRVQGPSSVARHIIREATGCLALRALGLEGHAVWPASERVAPVGMSHAAGPLQVVPLRFVAAAPVEDLNAMVLAVC
ncbi:MAG: hypothetical protein K2Q23_15080, partial [Bryobacteraceae bacterium]|nr:hypothetical protein [Bryobacteraceae bacterium]